MRLLTLAVVILFVGLFLNLHRTAAQPVRASDFSAYHDVVMFSAEWCGHCDRARSHLQRQGVDFLEIDIESSTEANRLFRDAGGHGVPLTFVDDQRLVGFSAESYSRALERLNR